MTIPAQKPCFKCHATKPIDDFYRHPMMADGHLNKCKECTKKDVQERYELVGGRPEYERKRSKTPKRKAAQKRYWKSVAQKNPARYKASYAVGNALRDGRLKKGPCEICGTTEKVQGHHDDYSKPLEVRWLCFKHHREDAHGQKIRE